MAERDTAGGILALLIGVGIGAAVAILYAPQPGDETRELLVRAAKHGKDRVAEVAEQFKSEIGISTSGVKERLHQAVQAGKSAYWEEIRQARNESSPY